MQYALRICNSVHQHPPSSAKKSACRFLGGLGSKVETRFESTHTTSGSHNKQQNLLEMSACLTGWGCIL